MLALSLRGATAIGHTVGTAPLPCRSRDRGIESTMLAPGPLF